MRDKALWQRLETFEIDTGDGNGDFAARLSDTYGWSKREVRRKLVEYRRFLYLAHFYPDDTAPPPDVLNIWQTHLLYTRSYWDDLCRDVLGAPLHHDPDAAERDAKDWRRRLRETQALYRDEFDRSPPGKDWPRTRSAATGWGIAVLIFGAVIAGAGALLSLVEVSLGGIGAVIAGLVLVLLGARRPARTALAPTRAFPKLDGEDDADKAGGGPEPVSLKASTRPAEPLTLKPPTRPATEPLSIRKPATRPVTEPLVPPVSRPADPVKLRPVGDEPPVRKMPIGPDRDKRDPDD